MFHAYREQATAFRRTNSGLELPIDAVIGNLDAMFGFENDPGAMEGPRLRDTRLYGPASGSAAALGYLKDTGYRIGVMSNTRYHGAVIRGLLEDAGLAGSVDEIVTSADVGFRKPRAEAYAAIADRIGADWRDVLFCGDSLSNDYYGPLSARLRGAVHIDPTSSAATWRIGSLGDLPGLFGGGERSPG